MKLSTISMKILLVFIIFGCSTSKNNVIYVDGEVDSSGDGASWAQAYTDLQIAIDNAQSGDEIWVKEGVYYPSREIEGEGPRFRSFVLKSGIAIYGGFKGDETSLAVRNWEVSQTVLSGDLNDNDVGFNENDENSYHVLFGENLDSATVIDGFMITGGNANLEEWPHDGGGGFSNWNGSPTVRNCTFSFNSAFADGGGMRNWENSNGRFYNCLFINNQSQQEGGGLMNGGNDKGSSPMVVNCRFEKNRTGEDGGGLYSNWYSYPKVINCLFIDNQAGLTGGAIYNVNYSDSQIINCSISRNSATKGGSISNRDSNPTIVNCILWGNDGDIENEIFNERSSPKVSFSNVKGGYDGKGNIDSDPFFESSVLRLSKNSPCLNVGNNEAMPSSIAVDLDGNPRIASGSIDMGVYEISEVQLNDDQK